MTELYWITRLDGISTFFLVIGMLLLFISVIYIIYVLDPDLEKDSLPFHRKRIYCFIFLSVLNFVAHILVPTTNEALLIYGVGGTIDYIKSNDKAKELPDKVVDALTRYVDSVSKENDEEG